MSSPVSSWSGSISRKAERFRSCQPLNGHSRLPLRLRRGSPLAAMCICLSVRHATWQMAQGFGVPFHPLPSPTTWRTLTPLSAPSFTVSRARLWSTARPTMVMPRQNLDNEEVANVVTFVLNSFGNDDGMVTPDDVQRDRKRVV